MADKLLVTGFSGTGKSFSLRTLDPLSTFIICPDEKNPVFKGWRKNYFSENSEGKFSIKTCNYLKTTNWETIRKALTFISESRKEIKVAVIDTITYAMIGEFMDKAKVTGFSKFTEMGSNVYQTLKMIDGLRSDLLVIVMAHTDISTFNGSDKTVFGTPGGKLVSDVVKPAGMFTIILETLVNKNGEDVEYSFMTQNNTVNMAKSPDGMFDSYIIPNDMQSVIDKITEYEN